MTRSRLPDGLYEHVISGALARNLGALEREGRTVTKEPLDSADAHAALALYVGREVERLLAAVPHADRPGKQVAMVNRVLESLRALGDEYGLLGKSDQATATELLLEEPGHELRAIHRVMPFERPATPLASSTLLTRNRAEPNLGGELAREIASSDRIDVIVAFSHRRRPACRVGRPRAVRATRAGSAQAAHPHDGLHADHRARRH